MGASAGASAAWHGSGRMALAQVRHRCAAYTAAQALLDRRTTMGAAPHAANEQVGALTRVKTRPSAVTRISVGLAGSDAIQPSSGLPVRPARGSYTGSGAGWADLMLRSTRGGHMNHIRHGRIGRKELPRSAATHVAPAPQSSMSKHMSWRAALLVWPRSAPALQQATARRLGLDRVRRGLDADQRVTLRSKAIGVGSCDGPLAAFAGAEASELLLQVAPALWHGAANLRTARLVGRLYALQLRQAGIL
jgi:hypothetical protein